MVHASHSSNNSLSLPQKIASAGLAGCTADLLTFPLDTVKVWLQVGAHYTVLSDANLPLFGEFRRFCCQKSHFIVNRLNPLRQFRGYGRGLGVHNAYSGCLYGTNRKFVMAFAIVI